MTDPSPDSEAGSRQPAGSFEVDGHLPAADIVRAAAITGARAIALGITMPEGRSLVAELGELRTSLPAGAELIVGGRGAEPLETRLPEAGIEYVPTHPGIREALERIGPGH